MSVDSGEKERKNLAIVLGFLSFLIVALVIGNIVIFAKANQTEEVLVAKTEELDGNYITNTDGTVVPMDDSQVGVPETSRSVETEGKTFEQIVSEYQTLIDNAQNDGEKARLYNERILLVFDEGNWGEYGNLIIEDAIAIDNIQKTVDSAVQVENVANSVGNKEIASQYNAIVLERNGVANDAITEYESYDYGEI